LGIGAALEQLSAYGMTNKATVKILRFGRCRYLKVPTMAKA
jgi:hypothetical protein